MTHEGVGWVWEGCPSPPKSQEIFENLVLKWCALVAAENQINLGFASPLDVCPLGEGEFVELFFVPMI